ncbi:MAG: hypothetical protein M3123_06850, partial [Actinomycetota bacterium]|nr:hypothetical protein [Actinomycetota bacterium]
MTLRGVEVAVGSFADRTEVAVLLDVESKLFADLGVVSVERARVRVPLDGPGVPTVTGLAASVDIPGTFSGRGTLDIRDDRLLGALDMTLVPLRIRASATVTVVRKAEVLGVLVGAEVHLPAPLPLGTSGLAILGFIGGLGVNMRRVEPSGSRTPALDWLAAQPRRDPLDGTGWGPDAGAWAIAAGAILGTTEGGFLFHVKGLVLLELPGPRLLLMARANVLSLPPGLRSAEEGQFLAVVDINPAGISAALVAEYSIVELIKVRVPIEAAFDYDVPSNWHVDLGRFDDPVSVEIFWSFRGSGYVMIHGNGITIPGLPALPSTGFAIAVGLRVTFIWGSEAIGLYLRVGAGFDAVLSFSPVGLTGQISLEGELRLFVVSVGANARLDVLSAPREGDLVPATWIHGRVCGEVDFWLFSVSGCVDFELGSEFTPAVPPAPLVADVLLVSRAPAHVEGSATAGPVDGVLARAKEDGTGDPAPEPVPLDALPVVVLDTAATPGPGFAVTHTGGPAFTVENAPVTRHRPWVRRGERWWRYEVLSVTLDGELTEGPRPATWWTLRGSPEPAAGGALALLSWVPEPTPRAIVYGEQLEESVRETWGGSCDPVAEPVPFLWHWNFTARGPSASGWALDGIAWPDPPGTVRTTPARATLRVTEPWRCGDPTADLRRGIDVARVVGGAVACPD